MRKWFVILCFSMALAQNPISDQGPDRIAEPGELVEISGANSYDEFIGDNGIVSYQWSVPQDILDANPGLDLQSETLSFIAPDISSTTFYSITLEVTDSDGDVSQEYDAPDLILSEYCESGASSDRYIEIYNGTGTTITSSEWENYEVWMARDGGDFMNPDQRFW